MSTDQRQNEMYTDQERKHWPVSLIGCLEPAEEQQSWPWFLFKALMCPATALGANETLFQEEEPADICCLQPRSMCGPTCRELNMQFCGLGNEGLKLCAHMCLLQAACSCMCLGLPLVAWLTALQRQRVVAKHGVDETGQDPWLTAALYPCSLLQMHALLQQQHNQQCAGQAAAPYKAPRVQQMVAECSSVSQAPSLPGPLTSAMSTSRVMRAVRTQSTKGPGSRLGDSISSDTSSGVVDNPYGQHPPEIQGEESVMCNLGDDIGQNVQQQQQQLHDERQTTPLLEHGAGSSSTSRLSAQVDGPLHMGSTCLSARSTNSSKHASPRPSSKGGTSASEGGAGVAAAIEQGPLSARRRLQQQQQQAQGVGTAGSSKAAGLPPKHRKSSTGHPSKTTSSSGGANPAAAGPPGPQPTHSPEPSQRTEVHAMFHQLQASCSGRSSQGEVPTPALQASRDAPAASMASHSSQHHRSKSVGADLSTVMSSGDYMSQGRLSYGASSAKLQLSQEDVPLMAIKPTPGRVPRGLSTGFSSSRGALGKGNVADSWQRHSGSHGAVDHPIGTGGAASSMHGSRRGSDCGTGGAAGGVQHQMQYATVQSDICNYASWLGGAGLSSADLHTGTAASGHTSRQQSTPQADSRQDSMNEQQMIAGPATVQKDVQRQQSPELQAGVGSNEEQFQPPSRQDSEALLGSIGAAKVSSSPVTLKTKAASKASFAGPHSVQQSSSILQQGRSHARPGRARMSDWAYTSDICNLGGSFEANVSTYGTGFAAALERLAEEGYDSIAEEGSGAAIAAAAGHVGSPAPAAATEGGTAALDSQQAQQQCRPPPAAGSWPDANPSPPSTLHETLDSQPSSNNGAELATAPAVAPAAPSAERNSSASSKSAAAQSGSQQKQSATETNVQAALVHDKIAVETAAPPAAGSDSAKASTTNGKRKPLSIDRDMIAAVTGTNSTEELTASQEELAAKLAKLAFANPAAARRLAGQRPPHQQQDMETEAAAAAGNTRKASAECFDGDEPFYPTMMSDMCNLAEPLSDEDEVQQAEDDGTARLLSAAAAASEAQQSVLKSVQQGLVTTAAQRRQQLQQRHSQKGQQHQQQWSTAGRLGGAASASSARSVAAGAGPLKSALLLRGAPQAARRPGMATQVATAARDGSPAGPAASGPAVNGTNSCFTLESFDSYYPDCDIKCSVDAPPNSKGRTFTVTPGGVIIETPGLTQFASGGSDNSSRASSPATAGAMVSTGVGSSPPKSPKRRAVAAAAAGQHANSALRCESAATAAAESDVQSGWPDVSRGASSAVSASAEAAAASARGSAAAGGGVGLKGLLGIASVQTSNSLWPVVDASAVARSGQH